MPGTAQAARLSGAGRFTVAVMTGPRAGATASGLANDLCDLAAEAFAAPPWNETSAQARQLTDRLLADAERAAFVLAVAFTGHGPGLAGFGYGVRRRPGPGLAAGALAFADPEPFEFCELAVRPAARGLGAGRALHDAVVGASGPQQRWLVTHPAARPAIGLYQARGWQTRRLFRSWTGTSIRLLMARPT